MDVVKRKIWSRWLSSAPKNVRFELHEEAVSLETVSEKYGECDVTWLIGNHSDELTPWMAVLARKLNANYLLIPCCSFDFDGTKFDKNQPNFKEFLKSPHRSKSVGTHAQYQSYIKSIALELCHFETFQEDILRIPSTKKQAFIGRLSEAQRRESSAWDFPLPYTISTPSEDGSKKLLPRHDWRTEVQNRVAFYLLRNVSDSRETEWSVGRQSTVKDIIRECSLQDKLPEIKSIKGGLKAILLHNSQLFQIGKFGEIAIRNWPEDNTKRRKLEHLKTRDCWFLHHHPQGCPLDDAQCSFRH